MSKQRVLILSAPEGHKSLALTVESILKDKNIATEVFVYEEAVLKIYRLFYLFAPHLFSGIFKLANTKIVSTIAEFYLQLHHAGRVRRLIDEFKPTHIMCTAYSFTPAIRKNQQKYDFKFINIFPNTTTFFRSDIAQTADANLILDDRVLKKVKAVKPHAKFIESGWFVRPEFKQLNSKAEITKLKEKLDLDPKLPVFLFLTGSEGTLAILKTVSDFVAQNGTPTQLVVGYGHNQILKKQLEQLQNSNPNSVVIPLGFTYDIYEYFQVANLAVGKAGPNSVFEAVATATPFFATTHIEGLENGVLETIEHYDIGEIVEEKDQALTRLLEYAKNNQDLDKFMPGLKKLANHNQKAAKVLLSVM